MHVLQSLDFAGGETSEFGNVIGGKSFGLHLAGGLFKIGCGTLAVVRLLPYAKRRQAYDNKMYAASFPMPFHASTMASFAIYHSMSLIA